LAAISPLIEAHSSGLARDDNRSIGTDVPVVVFDDVSLAFDDNVVLDKVTFSVRSGHMTILIGASGAGKSVVLKLILGLLKPDFGAIYVNGERIDILHEDQMMRVRDDIGMLFQESALFDSLTVADNVGYKNCKTFSTSPHMKRGTRMATSP
jgi:phospholipid/cholesterol/gamma-HCH transport system ATP-binding protein